MRVLVTGAFGYLGLALIRRLATTHTVVATGHPARNAAARATVPAGVEVVETDLERMAELPRAGFDAIVHLAGHAMDADPVAAVRAGVRGTALLAAAARAGGVPRLLFASSSHVYGTRRAAPAPWRETDAAAPDDLLGAVKESAELVWGAAGGTSLRLARVYGAGCGVDLGIRGLVEDMARTAAAGGDLPFSVGPPIDLVHVDDVAAAVGAALTAKAPLPAVLNVGGGAPVSLGSLASACLSGAHKLGVLPRVVAVDGPPPTDGWPSGSMAIGLAANVLHWQPRTRLQDGIDAVVRMMRPAGER